MRIGYLVHNNTHKFNYPFKNVLTISKQYAINALNNIPFYENIKDLIQKNIKEVTNEEIYGNFILIKTKYNKLV